MRLLALSFTGALVIATVAAQTPPTTSSTPAPKPRSTEPAGQPGGTTAKPVAMTVDVTDKSGNTIPGVNVAVSGPTDRSGVTGSNGEIVFRAMRPGTYRLRFEHEGFTTLEREVTIRAGQPASVTVSLSAAPEKPAPPGPAPVAAPPAPAPKPSSSRVVEPRSLDIPAFLQKNFIGNEPQKLTLLACAEGGTARLLQIRDPLNDQARADVDEILYVVAGNGVLHVRDQDAKLTPGYFALVPRGISHSLRRDGRNPLIVLSILAGTPCVDTSTPSR